MTLMGRRVIGPEDTLAGEVVHGRHAAADQRFDGRPSGRERQLLQRLEDRAIWPRQLFEDREVIVPRDGKIRAR
jgi:hypothetical protein